jgi:hypothetical protein
MNEALRAANRGNVSRATKRLEARAADVVRAALAYSRAVDVFALRPTPERVALLLGRVKHTADAYSAVRRELAAAKRACSRSEKKPSKKAR